ncbi:MAG: hypothetical protein M1822_007965 [Bathelium mastoideum]|nr:MAG: hypothetical protein M1822_007965 [Bathelium mastoideum]
MNYTPTFCLDLEPEDHWRPRNDWPYGHSYLSMAQHQAFYQNQQQQDQHPEGEQPPGADQFVLPYSAADDWSLTQALLEMSSPSSMSSLSSVPPGLTYSAVSLDGTDADPLNEVAPTPMTSATIAASAVPTSKPFPLFTNTTSPSDRLGPGSARGSSTSRRTSPGKEKASSPEQDASSSSKAPQPRQHEFITADHPNKFKEKTNMRKVRSRVMTDYVSKNESRRSASSQPTGTTTRSGRSKAARKSADEPTSYPRPSITSAPDFSRISPPTSLPIQTVPFFAFNPLSPGALVVHSPSSLSTSSSDSESSLTHKQLVHRRYQQALDLLLGQRSPTGLWTRPELIEIASRHFFDREQRHPTPLRNFLGTQLDAFRTMPQSSSRKVNVMRLKFSCAKFFGTRSMGASWVPAMLHHQIAFLSTLCIAAAHEDAMQLRTTDSEEMAAIKTEVTHRMIYEMQQVDNLEIMAILELLCSEIIRTGADESQLYMHSQSINKFVKQKGGLANLGLKGDLAKFLTTMTFNISVFCEIQPHTMYVQYIDTFKFPPPPPPEATIPESPLFCPRAEFFTLIDIGKDETRNRRCKPHTYELLSEMRDLTNHFCVEGKTLQALEARFEGEAAEGANSKEANLKQQEDARRKFQRISSRILQRVSRLRSASEPDRDETADWFYESVRLCSVVYTYALANHQPLSTAAQNLGTTAATENGRPVEVTYPRAIMLALIKSGIDDCWADMAGVLFWITLVGAAAGRNTPTPATPPPVIVPAAPTGSSIDTFSNPFTDPSLDPWIHGPVLADPFAAEAGESSAVGAAMGGGPGSAASVSSSALSPLSRSSPLRDDEFRRRAEARKWLVALAIRCSVLLGFSHGVPLMGSLRRLIMVQGLLGWGGRRMSASPW